MHKFLALSVITGFLFLLTSITSIAYEHKKINEKTNFVKMNIVYELKTIIDDYVLNYCSTYDSYTVNRLYSQKKILDENINIKPINKFLVSIKKKPLNPNIIKLLNKDSNLKAINLNVNEVDFDFLSETKKDFVKTLLPLISYENQNILLERSKIENIRDFLNNNNTLSKARKWEKK